MLTLMFSLPTAEVVEHEEETSSSFWGGTILHCLWPWPRWPWEAFRFWWNWL